MGKVIPCAEFARAGRRRLAGKLNDLIASAPQADVSTDAKLLAFESALGKAVHDEATRRYHTAEIPAEMRPAPWLWVIGKLAEEHADPFARLRADLRKCVEVYLESLRNAPLSGESIVV